MIWARIDLAQNLRSQQGRSNDLVSLVAVSKRHLMTSRLTRRLAAGQRVFGENRVQEAQGPLGTQRRDQHAGLVTLHLIGPLQTNKVR